MSPADWRALISAFLEGRLSAAAFCKRFSEAFELVVRERRPVPQRVQDLYFVVEAYGGDPMGRGHDVSDDQDLRAAAAAALAALPDVAEPEPVGVGPGVAMPDLVILREPPPGGGPRREEARREVRRAAFTLGAVGMAGCLIGLAWLAVGILQFFAASAQIDAWLKLGPAPSAILGLGVAFTPIVGSLVAFLGATGVWGWANWVAALVFLVAPALTLIGGIDRWRRWRRH